MEQLLTVENVSNSTRAALIANHFLTLVAGGVDFDTSQAIVLLKNNNQCFRKRQIKELCIFPSSLDYMAGEISKYLYNQSGRDIKKGIFLNAKLCQKSMCFIKLYRVWIYLSIMVDLPNFCRKFFLSNVHFSLSLPDRKIILL